MVVMTIMGAVLTVGITGLVKLFRVQAGEVQSLSEAAVWRRLSRDFRSDAHNARQAGAADSSRLELQTVDGSIVWSVADDAVRRQFQPSAADTGAARSETAGSVEHYRLPSAGISLGLTVPDNDQRQIAVLVVNRPGDPHTRPTAGRIEAALGLSLRFQQPPAQGDRP